MSSTACYLDDSAQNVRLLTSSSDSKWSPSNDLGDEDAFAAKNRLGEIAGWLTEQIEPRKRIDLICLGVTDSMCRWLTAPSAEPSVIAAAARGKGEEWGPGAALGTIEPLTSPHKKSARKPSARTGDSRHFPVLAIRDAAARVLLDNLDTNGVRVGSVITFWHAMCRAWDESLPSERVREELYGGSDNGNTEPAGASSITAIITTTDDNTIAWAWSRGRQLITGGRAVIGRTETVEGDNEGGIATSETNQFEAAFGRIALDWLTWGAQLGQMPEQIVIVSPNANKLAEQCNRLWPAAPYRQVPEIDPITATLNRLISADPIKPESDARSCVATLTNRPSKAHRMLNQWVGVAMIGVAIAIAGLGWQFHSQAGDYSSQESGFHSENVNKLTEIDPRLARDSRPVLALQNRINQQSLNDDGFEEPALPLPILSELLRVAQSLEETEGVKVERIEITESRSSLRLTIPDTVTGEKVIEALRTSRGKIRWTETTIGTLTDRLNFNGAWNIEEERL